MAEVVARDSLAEATMRWLATGAAYPRAAERTSGIARGLTWRRVRAWNADMASDPQVVWNFECPSCGAKYLKTKIEDQAENREGANCEHCLASFEPREGAYLFQYELVEHPSAGR